MMCQDYNGEFSKKREIVKEILNIKWFFFKLFDYYNRKIGDLNHRCLEKLESARATRLLAENKGFILWDKIKIKG